MNEINDDPNITRIGEMFGVPVYFDPYSRDEIFTLGYKALDGNSPGMIFTPYVKAGEIKTPEGATKFEPAFIIIATSMERLSQSAKIVKMAILSKCPTWKFDSDENLSV